MVRGLVVIARQLYMGQAEGASTPCRELRACGMIKLLFHVRSVVYDARTLGLVLFVETDGRRAAVQGLGYERLSEFLAAEMADLVTVKPMATYDGAPLRMTAVLTELEAAAPQFTAAPADAPDPYLQQSARRPKMNTYRRCARAPVFTPSLYCVLFFFLWNV